MIELLIILHALFGGIALLAGLLALVSKKGKSVHKASGKVFYYTMLSSAILALVISFLPGHKNAFLFSIGIFSIYFILSGYRALKYKYTEVNFLIDKLISYSMLVTAIWMIAYHPIMLQKINPVLMVFGIGAFSFAWRDLRLYSKIEKLKENWLKLHLGKMSAAYISASTAFIVVNELLPGLFAWFMPALLGTVYIVYWTRKVSK